MFHLDQELLLFEFSVPLVLAAARRLGLGLTRKQNDVDLLYLADEALQDEYSEDQADMMRKSGSVKPGLSKSTVEEYMKLIAERRSMAGDSLSSRLPSNSILRGVHPSPTFAAEAAKPPSPTAKGRPMPADVSFRPRRRRWRGGGSGRWPQAAVLPSILEEEFVAEASCADGGKEEEEEKEELPFAFSSDDDDDTEEGSSSSSGGSGSECDGVPVATEPEPEAAVALQQASRRTLTFGEFLAKPSARNKKSISLLLQDDPHSIMARPGKGLHARGPPRSPRGTHDGLAAATLAASTRSLPGTVRRAPGAARGPLLSMLEGADWSAAAGAASPVAGF